MVVEVVVVVIIVVSSFSTSFDFCEVRPQSLIPKKCWGFRVAGTVARRTHQFVTFERHLRHVLQERIHEFSALLTFIGIQSFLFRFLANDFLVAKGGRIIHRGYCICCCCCCCWLGSSTYYYYGRRRASVLLMQAWECVPKEEQSSLLRGLV